MTFIFSAMIMLVVIGSAIAFGELNHRRSQQWPHGRPGSDGTDADLARVLHDVEAARAHRRPTP